MLIVGSSGRIAQRYKAILNHLKHPFFSYDVNFKPAVWPKESIVQSKDLHRIIKNELPIIIATPSDTHYRVLKRFYDLGGRKFLIEKPIFTNSIDYTNAKDAFPDALISGIANYRYLDETEGKTTYDYFDAGQEKWYWNLFQIIALARGEIELKSDSPVWKCALNGKKLSLEDVHQSYILQIQEFLNTPEKCLSLEEGEEWFYKVKRYVRKLSDSASKPDLAAPASQGKSLPK